MKSILITGGAGFIGSHFTRYMLDRYPDYSVIVLDVLTYAGNLNNLKDVWDNPRFEFVHGDITDREIVQSLAERTDAIVNFAAESHNDRAILDPENAVRTNLNGVVVLLEASRKFAHERFLQVSTDEVYGTTDGTFREVDALEPNQPYSAAKAGAELIVRSYNKTFGLPTLITRGSNTFGPYQYPEKIIPFFVTNLIDGKSVPLYGDGQQVRDWMYVEDHCRGIDTVLHHGLSGEAYNIGGGNERPNLEIVRLLLAQLHKDEGSVRFVKDRPGHDRRYSLDCTKISQIGYTPTTVGFEDRLNTTIDWYVQHEDWWRPTLSNEHEHQDFLRAWYADR